MSYISNTYTQLPANQYSTKEILVYTNKWLSQSPILADLSSRIMESSKINQRFFILPLDQILNRATPKERSDIFKAEGLQFVISALNNFVEKYEFDLSKLKNLIFVSCSVPLIPALDAYLINNSKIPKNINRIPLYQHGCIGGAVALSIAHKLDSSIFDHTLIVSLELCSLVFSNADLRSGNILGASLFADGCGICLVSNQNNPNSGNSENIMKHIGSQSFLIPDSSEIMGFDITNMGTTLILDKDIPSTIAKNLPQFIHSFLNQYELNFKDITHWLLHPGGKKIIDFIEVEFQLQSSQTIHSWNTLMNSGNTSSSSIFFVIDEFLKNKNYKEKEFCLVIGIGPGLSLQAILYQIVGC